MLKLTQKNQADKIHKGSIAMFLGLILIFAGGGSILQIADNHILFIVAIFFNLYDFLTKVRSVRPSFFLVTMAIFFGLTCCFYGFGKAESDVALSMLVLTLLVISCLLCKYNGKDVELIVNGVIISAVILSILTLFFGNGYSGAINEKYTYTQSFGQKIEFEPNFLALFLFTGCEFGILYFIKELRKSKKIKALIYAVCVAISLVASLRTGSRAVIVGFAIYLVVLFFMIDKTSVKIKMLFAILILIALFAFLCITGIIPPSIYERLFKISYLDGSNMKRLANWSYGLKAMFSTIFGHGVKNSSVVLSELYGYHAAAHNTFIAIGVMYGFVGFMLLLGVIAILTLKMWCVRKRENIAMIISLFVMWNILECELTIAMWMVLLVLILECEIEARKKVSQNQGE